MLRCFLLPLQKKPTILQHLLRFLPFAHRRYSSVRPHSSPPPHPPVPLVPFSRARLRKLIATHPDPLVAKEILSLAASLDPILLSSASSYPPIHALILRLARARHFSLADSLLLRLRSPSPGLFSSLLRIYSDSSSPDLALSAFRHLTIRHPDAFRPRHLNRLLSALAPHPHYLPTAISLFNSSLNGSLCDGGVSPNAQSLNIVMRAACRVNKLSVAYSLFNRMFERGVAPNVESYRILMQGLCRKSQVNTAVDLLDDMLNKGYVPDALTYTTLLNSLCRKKRLREAYKLLCRMKVKCCNPDIVHYNTVIIGFCREGRPLDACKVLDEMTENGCLPNLVSYTMLVNGLWAKGFLEEARSYLEEMLSKRLVPHFSVFHGLIKGLCSVGKDEEACDVLEEMLKQHVAPHLDTWELTVRRACDQNDENLAEVVEEVTMTEEWKRCTRIVDAYRDVARKFPQRKPW